MEKRAKIADLLDVIQDFIARDRFLDTRHANERRNQRKIIRNEMLYVLKHGHHEKRKDKFESRFDAWNYAIRGKTLDRRELRVVISFDDDSGMLVITAIELTGSRGK